MDNKKSNEKDVIDYDADYDADILKTPIDLRDTFYSNGIRITGGEFDFILDFFEQPIKDDGCFEGIRIFVNPVNYKLFTKLFKEQLERYEKQFGEIKV